MSKHAGENVATQPLESTSALINVRDARSN
jgi:hypothetical protein